MVYLTLLSKLHYHLDIKPLHFFLLYIYKLAIRTIQRRALRVQIESWNNDITNTKQNMFPILNLVKHLITIRTKIISRNYLWKHKSQGYPKRCFRSVYKQTSIFDSTFEIGLTLHNHEHGGVFNSKEKIRKMANSFVNLLFESMLCLSIDYVCWVAVRCTCLLRLEEDASNRSLKIVYINIICFYYFWNLGLKISNNILKNVQCYVCALCILCIYYIVISLYYILPVHYLRLQNSTWRSQ